MFLRLKCIAIFSLAPLSILPAIGQLASERNWREVNPLWEPMTLAEVRCIAERRSELQGGDEDPFALERPLMCGGAEVPAPKTRSLPGGLVLVQASYEYDHESPYPVLELRNDPFSEQLAGQGSVGEMASNPSFGILNNPVNQIVVLETIFLSKNNLDCFVEENIPYSEGPDDDVNIVLFNSDGCNFIKNGISILGGSENDIN